MNESSVAKMNKPISKIQSRIENLEEIIVGVDILVNDLLKDLRPILTPDTDSIQGEDDNCKLTKSEDTSETSVRLDGIIGKVRIIKEKVTDILGRIEI